MPPKKAATKGAAKAKAGKDKKETAGVAQPKVVESGSLTSGQGAGTGTQVAKVAVLARVPETAEKLDTAAINRLFRTKLKKFNKDELVALVGKTSGMSVRRYLQQGIDSLSNSKKHLSSKFWAEFFTEFGLQSPMFEGIESLVDENAEDPPTDLLDALVEAVLYRDGL